MFRLSHELGKHLHEVLGYEGPPSLLHYDCWEIWLELQWNKPSRTDYHIMRAAYEARYCMSGEKPSVKNLSKAFGVSFKEPEPPLTQEEIKAKNAKIALEAEKMLCASLGLKFGVSTPPD